METFLTLYPYIILTMGLATALGAVLGGLFLAYVTLIWWAEFDDWVGQVVLAGVFFTLGNGAAVCFLTFTKYMLS